MKTKSTLALLLLLAFFLTNCDEEKPTLMADMQSEAITTKSNPKDQAEIQAVLDDIFYTIQTKDADRLIAHHAYGPKFTDFRDSELRTGSAENEAYERGFVGAISFFDYELNDLNLDVFGKVAVVTYHADFRPTIEENTLQINGQVPLIFIKLKNTWKITHEHFSPLNIRALRHSISYKTFCSHISGVKFHSELV